MLSLFQNVVALLTTLTTGVWPLDPVPEVVHGFDPPAHDYAPGHRGVDLLGSPGQPVRAVDTGTVTYAGMLAGRGVVVVDHQTTRTTYQPVTARVEVGDTVLRGEPVGSLAAGGSHCLPRACLHLGLLEGDTYLDPLSVLGPREVRLLPLLSELPAGTPALSTVGGPHQPVSKPSRPELRQP